jgi:aminoglycoside phosphotransferase (APT) family kinase protein
VQLLGRPLPLVFYHADLRAKHVQVDEQGNVLGFLDWGTAEAQGLPYFDLLHLVVHEVKQEHGLSAGAAWRRMLARELRGHEEACLERYRELMGLEPDVARAIERIYPVLVAAMAEKNWDYSRPRWLARQFELA